MSIFDHWKASLASCAPDRLGPFLSRVMQTTIIAYKVWFKQGWILLLAAAVSSSILPWIHVMIQQSIVASILWIVQFFVVSAPILLLFIIIKQLLDGQQGRPLQDIRYYYGHIGFILIVYGLFFAVVSLLCMISPLHTSFVHKVGIENTLVYEIALTFLTYIMVALYSSLISVIFILFLFDGPLNVSGIWRALSNTFWFLLLNLPLMIGAYLMLKLVELAFGTLFTMMSFILLFIVPAFVILLLNGALLPLVLSLYGQLWALSRKNEL